MIQGGLSSTGQAMPFCNSPIAELGDEELRPKGQDNGSEQRKGKGRGRETQSRVTVYKQLPAIARIAGDELFYFQKTTC